MKIDTHVHCPVPSEGQQAAACAHDLRQYLQGQGICRAILMSSGEYTGQLAFPGINEQVRKIAEAEPDFYSWMCNIDPVSPETVLERLARYQAQRAVGIGELVINRWIEDPFLQAVFEAAQKLHLPVTIHMSPEPGYSYGICDKPGLPMLEALLKAYPELTVVGHSSMFWLEISGDCPKEGNAARNGYGQGPVAPGGAVARLFRQYPNLYGDLSATSGSTAIMRDEAFGVSFLETYKDRLFFATDSFDTRKKFPLGEFLDRCRADGRLSEEAWNAICFENAMGIYKIK